jgi:hypothetical protein
MKQFKTRQNLMHVFTPALVAGLMTGSACTPSSQTTELGDDGSESSDRQAVVIGGTTSPSPSESASPSPSESTSSEEEVTTEATQNCDSGEYVSEIRIRHDNSGITDLGIRCDLVPMASRPRARGEFQLARAMARPGHRHMPFMRHSRSGIGRSHSKSLRLVVGAGPVGLPGPGDFAPALVAANWLLGVSGTSHTVLQPSPGAAFGLVFEQKGELICNLQEYTSMFGVPASVTPASDPCSSVPSGIISMTYNIDCGSNFISGFTGTFDSSGHLIGLQGNAGDSFSACSSSSSTALSDSLPI